MILESSHVCGSDVRNEDESAIDHLDVSPLTTHPYCKVVQLGKLGSHCRTGDLAFLGDRNSFNNFDLI